jgi:hypothetical protein
MHNDASRKDQNGSKKLLFPAAMHVSWNLWLK